MLVPLAFLLGLQQPSSPAPSTAQGATSQVTPSAPSMSAGTNSAFHHACLDVEERLAKGEFDDAAKLAARLPKRELTLAWNDAAVPSERRAEFQNMRDAAIQAWSKQVKGLKIVVAPTGDVAVTLVPTLPDGAQGMPAASTLTFGDTPRLAVQVSLQRGKPAVSASNEEVYTETAHAIGAYFGVVDSPFGGSPMYRSDLPHLRAFAPRPADTKLIEYNLQVADALREAVKNKTRLTVGAPKLTIDPKPLDLGDVRQGQPAPFAVTFTNAGTGGLQYSLIPDCSCFGKFVPGVAAPGEPIKLEGKIDTSEYTGVQHKRIALFTNDPDRPTVEIPVTFRSIPAYRMYRPEGENVVVSEGGSDVDVFLVLPPNSDIKPQRVEFDGIEGKVTMTPWKGELPDDEMGEGPMPRQGYRFRIRLADTIPVGRMPGTLQVVTSSKTFPNIKYTVYGQKGIVALPESVFLGEMKGPQKAAFLVSRPGKPFKILEITSENSSLHAVATEVKAGQDYRIDVDYDGKAPQGDFFGVLHVKTDDPKQPTLDLAVTGTVR